VSLEKKSNNIGKTETYFFYIRKSIMIGKTERYEASNNWRI